MIRSGAEQIRVLITLEAIFQALLEDEWHVIVRTGGLNWRELYIKEDSREVREAFLAFINKNPMGFHKAITEYYPQLT